MKYLAALLLGATLMLLLCDWAGAEEPKQWYICTSIPYQLTFGTSQTCPNVEQKMKRELKAYLIWAYREYGRRQAMEAFRSFSCGWVEK